MSSTRARIERLEAAQSTQRTLSIGERLDEALRRHGAMSLSERESERLASVERSSAVLAELDATGPARMQVRQEAQRRLARAWMRSDDNQFATELARAGVPQQIGSAR